jgi:hypothetical protein
VTLTPDLSSIYVIEDTNIHLQCTTSLGFPAPTVRWYKTSGEAGATPVDVTSQSTSTASQNGTSSTLSLTPSRADHGLNIHCTAENLGHVVMSARTPTLNILCMYTCNCTISKSLKWIPQNSISFSYIICAIILSYCLFKIYLIYRNLKKQKWCFL